MIEEKELLNLQDQPRFKKIFDFFVEIEFYLKIAISCTIIQQIFYWLLHDIKLGFMSQVLLYWAIGSVSFYSFGLFIEKVIKKNASLTKKLNVRVKQVKKQTFPAFTAKSIIMGEIQSLIAALIILYVAPEVNRGNSLLLNFQWFLMRIIVFDFCFYVTHWLLHQKYFLKIHLKHHQFSDISSFVAGYKSLTEYIIVTIMECLPIFLLGYDITQLCAWIIIGNIYNLEGHSSLSIFFIHSDFHDLHHTSFNKNYGINGFWDKVFNTLNNPTRKPGIMFPVNMIEAYLNKSNKKQE